MAEHGYSLRAPQADSSLGPTYGIDGVVCPEPEAVDPATIDPGWYEAAQARRRVARSEEQQRRELRAMSSELRRVPVTQDLSTHLIELRRVLDAMRRAA